MHADIRPFWPFSDSNPLFDPTFDTTVVSFCLLAGIAGFFVLAVRFARNNRLNGASSSGP